MTGKIGYILLVNERIWKAGHFVMKRIRKIYLIYMAGILLLMLAAVFIFAGKKAGREKVCIITGLKVCHVKNPLGIDVEQPVFGWRMESGRQGAAQSAYRVCVADGRKNLAEGNFLWDSGKVAGSESVGIVYEGEALAPAHRYFWQVEVWDESDRCHKAAEEAWFETGLMGEGMSGAKWISARQEETKTESEKDLLFYTIRYQMEVSGTSAGFIFGAQEGRYGSLYVCEIKNQGDEKLFTLKRMEEGAVSSEESVDISDCAPEGQSLFQAELSVEEEKLGVKINGKEAGTFVILPVPAGSIGYYKSRGVSYAWLDDILVSSRTGDILYKEDFEEKENIFTPYYTPVEGGRLKIGSGLMLTKGFESPAPLFRRAFQVEDKEIVSARVYMTALGCFALSVNGKRVSEDYFSPGKLAYNKQLSYVTYDVTDFLERGKENALGIILLHGWYDRGVGYPEIWNPWGDKNALLGKMEIRYQDGSVSEIVTDGSFYCCTDGPVRDDDLYQGEFYDANCEKTGFDKADYSMEGWYPAEENQVNGAYLSLPLVGKKNEPISCVEILKPVEVTKPLENVLAYDFGQNFAGTCRIKVKGKKGQVVTLRYGEEINKEAMINKDDVPGTVWTENLLTAEATDYYVLKGDAQGEVFEPEFTFHGFRYLQIDGLGEELQVEDVEGIVLSSDLERTGEFQCSDDTLNQYYQNTVWSLKSNFMDNPMDCPQRDERHGWAGDAQIFSKTASYHMDAYNFYEKYLNDLRLIQSEGGSFPDMAPRNFGTGWDGTGGSASNNCWGDAPVVIAWNLYTQYGEKGILEENYDALCKWVDMLVSTSDNYVRTWGGYGDHLAFEDTPSDLSDTAWCAHSADLLSRMAKALGKEEDAVRYREIYENFKQAWQNQYVLPDGQTSCNTQTSYALGLAFSLFPEELKEAAAGHLRTLAEYGGYHIKTGYSGIGCLLTALSDNGMVRTAYKMLLLEEYPSLLYIVNNGATTTWESLFGYQQEENGFRLDGSLNHYAYGTPAGWLYTDVLGIRCDEEQPGYKHIILEPQAGGELTFAKGSYTGAYGKISVEWRVMEEGLEYCFEIPANTTASLYLPQSACPYEINGKQADKIKGIVFTENDGEKVKYELQSGTYRFTNKKQGRK